MGTIFAKLLQEHSWICHITCGFATRDMTNSLVLLQKLCKNCPHPEKLHSIQSKNWFLIGQLKTGIILTDWHDILHKYFIWLPNNAHFWHITNSSVNFTNLEFKKYLMWFIFNFSKKNSRKKFVMHANCWKHLMNSLIDFCFICSKIAACLETHFICCNWKRMISNALTIFLTKLCCQNFVFKK